MSHITRPLMLGVAALALGLGHTTPASAMPAAGQALSHGVQTHVENSTLVEEVRRGRNRRAAIIGGTALGVGLLAGAAIANSSRHDPYYDYGYGYGYGPRYYREPEVYYAPPRRVYRYEPVYPAHPYGYHHGPRRSAEEQWFDNATGN